MAYKLIPIKDFENDFKKLFKKYNSLKNDLTEFGAELQKYQNQGIPLGKDCYKCRMAISSKSKGKSGGARIITCVKIIKETIYLIAIFD